MDQSGNLKPINIICNTATITILYLMNIHTHTHGQSSVGGWGRGNFKAPGNATAIALYHIFIVRPDN